MTSDRLTQQPDTIDGGEGRRQGIDEDRDDRLRSDVAEDDLDRLHGAVIYLHVKRDGQVDALGHHRLREASGQVFRDVQPAGLAAVVSDALGGEADAERGHQPVEETVVVVRAEVHHDVGVELQDEPTGLVEGALELRRHLRVQFGVLQQRTVASSQQRERHWRSPPRSRRPRRKMHPVEGFGLLVLGPVAGVLDDREAGARDQ